MKSFRCGDKILDGTGNFSFARMVASSGLQAVMSVGNSGKLPARVWLKLSGQRWLDSMTR
jgi:hypothetical protein